MIMFINERYKTNNVEYLYESQIEQIRQIGLSISNKIEGGFLNKKQVADLQKEIEFNYDPESDVKLGQDSNDIRKSVYNYESPLAEKEINGVYLKVVLGLVEGEPYSGNRRKTYLLYADENIVGKFYSLDDIIDVIKYIEDNLVKSLPYNSKKIAGRTTIHEYSHIRDSGQNETSNNKLYGTLMALRSDLALSAQKVYNEWEQDEEGYDEVYGSGGICDDIADAMCDIINNKTNYDCFHLYNEYDCHTSIYVYDTITKQIYNVDIPPYVYEKGTGYNWKKINNVSFNLNHINITEVEWDIYLDDDGNIKDEWD